MYRFRLCAAGVTLALFVCGAPVHAQPAPARALPNAQFLPNMAQQITPLAPPGSRFEPLKPDLQDKPDWLAGQAVSTALSRDGKTPLVLTSGYNRVYTTNFPPAGKLPWYGTDSNEYVFIYDISAPTPVKKQVVQVPALTPYTDRFYRGFDNSLPDFYRYTEWARDFDARYAGGPRGGTDLPALSLVRLMHDHTGNFGQAIDGVNTADLEVAANDYAVGLLVAKIARSAYANNTLIFVVEDDAQDGGDHVDSHRSTAFVVGAYVKQGALVSTQYTTVDFVRTIEDVLGLASLNLNDALARPMADIFSTVCDTALPLPARRPGLVVPKPTRDAKYWAGATRGLDLTDADRVDPALFNRILWAGMMANTRYPAVPAMQTRRAK
jgi:hypothetical protein